MKIIVSDLQEVFEDNFAFACESAICCFPLSLASYPSQVAKLVCCIDVSWEAEPSKHGCSLDEQYYEDSHLP